MSTKASIIITCYNLGEYLQEAIDSVPDGPYEVIVVDDGSTDPRTREIVKGLDRTRCRVLEQANTGLGRARNNGIALATGSYIIPLDADNRLNAEGLARAVALLDAAPDVDIAYGNAIRFGKVNELWEVPEYDFRRLLRRNYIDACACFRRTVWERLGGYDEQMPHQGFEDWDFWLRASAAGMHFRHLGVVFFDYRVRSGSMLQGALAKAADLTTYIFSKPSLRFLGPLRTEYFQLREEVNRSLGIRGPLRLIFTRMIRIVSSGPRAGKHGNGG